MPDIILVIGLPGSGKTTLLDKIRKSEPDATIIDDITSLEELPLVFTGRLFISSPLLCTSWQKAISVLQSIYTESYIETWFFPNDPKTCIERTKKRGDNRVISENFILNISKNYYIPDNAIILSLNS